MPTSSMMMNRLLLLSLTLASPIVGAQSPSWQVVVEGESLFIDQHSLSSNPDAPDGQKWVDFDALLNTPVPADQAEAAELNAFFGPAPKTFFNHMTLNCSQMSLRENSSGIAHGTFQTPRRTAAGQPWQPFELDQLIEYDLHSQPTFSSIADSPEAARYQQLLCQGDVAPEPSRHLSLLRLHQVLPNVGAAPQLVALANMPHKHLDLASITKRVDKAAVRDFNIVYHMPADDPQFTAATAPYGLDRLTMVFDRSIDCQARSMRANYRAVVADYAPDALLLEYRPQAHAAYLPISAEEQPLYDLVCPATAPPAPKAAAVAAPAATQSIKAPFRTDYD